MDIRLHNTLSREKQVFSPQNPQRVTMYVCGPTVYSYAHIGNARPPVAFDVLFRLLRAKYGESHVVYAANITDVDDKIIAAAAETGRPIAEITAHYEKIYREDMGALGVLEPTFRPHATDHIDGMVEIIRTLVEKGHAYPGKAGVLFHVPSMADYGKLSGRSRDDMVAGARVEVDAGKKDPADFALWKAAKPGEPKEARWDSPWGEGRPGWHIECSAMAKAVLGETIDIHAGGLDLIFPHHENEIAQSECAHGKPMARYWLHNGFLDIDSEKMSKSLGNVKLVHDLLKRWDGEVLRMALLSAHYRQPLNFTEDLLRQCKKRINRLYKLIDGMGDVEPDLHFDRPPPTVVRALCDDLNTPLAIAELEEFARWAAKRQTEDRAILKRQILLGGELLGLLQKSSAERQQQIEAEDSDWVSFVVDARLKARKANDYVAADALRNVLSANGVWLMDSATTSTWQLAEPRLMIDTSGRGPSPIPSLGAVRNWMSSSVHAFNSSDSAHYYEKTLIELLPALRDAAGLYVGLLRREQEAGSRNYPALESADSELLRGLARLLSSALIHQMAVRRLDRVLTEQFGPLEGRIKNKLNFRLRRLGAYVARIAHQTFLDRPVEPRLFRQFGSIGEHNVTLHGLWLQPRSRDPQAQLTWIREESEVQLTWTREKIVSISQLLWNVTLFVLAASQNVAQRIQRQIFMASSHPVDEKESATAIEAIRLLLDVPNYTFGKWEPVSQTFLQLSVPKATRSTFDPPLLGSFFRPWPHDVRGSFSVVHTGLKERAAPDQVRYLLPEIVRLRGY